jgi:hypothetical protein
VFRVEINESGTVREDKSNSVKIVLNENFPHFREHPEVSFKGLSLGDASLYENARRQIFSGGDSEFKENVFYIFFSLKPNFGIFKASLQPDTLARVQKTQILREEESAIEIKVMFTKSLRPSHCLQEEFQVPPPPPPPLPPPSHSLLLPLFSLFIYLIFFSEKEK